MKKKVKPKITPHLDTFAGIKLEQMTKQREVVAAEMGLRWGFVGTYRTQFYLRDSIIFTWLRTIPAEAKDKKPWSVDRAEMVPDEAMKAALEWAGKVGISINSARFKEAWAIFLDTTRQIREAKGEPISDDDSPPPPDTSGEL